MRGVVDEPQHANFAGAPAVYLRAIAMIGRGATSSSMEGDRFGTRGKRHVSGVYTGKDSWQADRSGEMHQMLALYFDRVGGVATARIFTRGEFAV